MVTTVIQMCKAIDNGKSEEEIFNLIDKIPNAHENVLEILGYQFINENNIFHLIVKGYSVNLLGKIWNLFPKDYGLENFLNYPNFRGYTTLHLAVINSEFEMVNFLLRKGAKPNIEDKAYNTPLYYAAIEDNFEIYNLLINEHAKLIHTDCLGNTSLHRKAKSSDPDLVSIKLLLGLNPQLTDYINNEGKKPVDLIDYRSKGVNLLKDVSVLNKIMRDLSYANNNSTVVRLKSKELSVLNKIMRDLSYVNDNSDVTELKSVDLDFLSKIIYGNYTNFNHVNEADNSHFFPDIDCIISHVELSSEDRTKLSVDIKSSINTYIDTNNIQYHNQNVPTPKYLAAEKWVTEGLNKILDAVEINSQLQAVQNLKDDLQKLPQELKTCVLRIACKFSKVFAKILLNHNQLAKDLCRFIDVMENQSEPDSNQNSNESDPNSSQSNLNDNHDCSNTEVMGENFNNDVN